MPNDDPSTLPTPIPPELREQLTAFQKHLWRAKVTEAVLAGVFGLIVSFLLVFFIERAIPLPSLLRVGILLAGTSLAAVFAPIWIRRWVYGHKREDQLARLIARKFPALGDRLLGVIELQDQKEVKEALSPELRAAAMAHVAAQAAKRDMSSALPKSWEKKLILGVILALGISIVVSIFAPKATLNAFRRWLMPLSETEHYTFTRFDLSELPDPLVVPRGESFSFRLPLSEESDQRPAAARARYGQQEWIESSLQDDGSYRFLFSGQQEKNLLSFEAGDARGKITVEPEIRPKVTNLEAIIELPDYLQLPPRIVDVRTGSLSVLEESAIRLRGCFSRALASGQARLEQFSLNENEEDVEMSTESTETPVSLAISKAEILTDPIVIQPGRARLPLTWTDIKNLDGADAFTLRIESTSDEAPLAYISEVDRAVAILAEETVTFRASAEDDYGLKEIGIAWVGRLTSPSAKEPARGEMILKKGSPVASRLESETLFSPLTHQIEPQQLSLSVYTLDYRPGSERVYSKPIIIYVLNRDEHAEIIKSRFDRVINELENLARTEQDNIDANERLDQKKSDEELQEEDGRQQLAESEEREAESIERMEKLSKEMEKLFQDAIRNGSLDPKTMKELSEVMENLEELAKEDLPEAKKDLESSQNEKSTPEKAGKDLKSAIEKQKAALEKMKETAAKASEANKKFEAATFVNRLKKAARDEQSISSALIEALTEESLDEHKTPLLGASETSDDIDPVYQRLLKQLGEGQQKTRIDVRWIVEDLQRFHARTKKQEHLDLYTLISDSSIDQELGLITEQLSANHSFSAARLSRKWAKQLEEWASKLSPSGGAGGEGNNNDNSAEQQHFEFMLKVLRMVQAEQDIQSRMRSIEQYLRGLELREQAPPTKPIQ